CSRVLTLERRSALANVPRPDLRPGLLLDFAKAHHLSRDARSVAEWVCPRRDRRRHGCRRRGYMDVLAPCPGLGKAIPRRPARERAVRLRFAREARCYGVGVISMRAMRPWSPLAQPTLPARSMAS